MARIQEENSVNVTMTNKSPTYSPIDDLAIKNGKKAAHVVRDDVRRGIFNSFAELMAAFLGSSPFCRRTIMDSDMTMALSTSRPRAMMRDASET